MRTLLTKMNGLLPIHFAPKSSLPPPRSGRQHLRGFKYFSQQLRSNASLRSLAPKQLQTLNKDVLEPPPNIFTLIMPTYRGRYCQCQLTPTNLIPNERSAISSIVLEEDFHLREDAYLTFPPKINNSIIRKAIGHFQVNIENIIEYIDHVCYYCSQFIDPLELKSICGFNDYI